MQREGKHTQRTKAKNLVDKDLVKSIAIDDIQSEYLLQSSVWARIKSNFGWTTYGFRQEAFPNLSRDILVLVHKVSSLGYLAYIPDGILRKHYIELHCEEKETELQMLVRAQESPKILQLVHQTGEGLEKQLANAFELITAIFIVLQSSQKLRLLTIRVDFPWLCKKPAEAHVSCLHTFRTRSKIQQIAKGCMVFPRETVQPPATVLLNLMRDEETLLANMKSKTRYNVKLGEKKGLTIRDDISLDEFYDLYTITSRRNHISIHSKDYYRKVVDELRQDSASTVYIYGAMFEERIIASILVAYFTAKDESKTATYLYGASSDEHRNLMPAYALQWHAMRKAKQDGCKEYDMFGIPDKANARHRMNGIYKFKIGFGGTELCRIAAYDIVLKGITQHSSRLLYRIFVLAEKMRHWYYYQYKKR